MTVLSRRVPHTRPDLRLVGRSRAQLWPIGSHETCPQHARGLACHPSLVLLMFQQVQCDDMQDTKPLPPSIAATAGSSPTNVLDRVIAIAPASLLPGEKEADYATIAARIVSASGPGDAIEEFLIRDVVDLTWEILRLRRAKAGILKSSMRDGVFAVGTRVTPRPPHRSGQAQLRHPAPASGNWRQVA